MTRATILLAMLSLSTLTAAQTLPPGYTDRPLGVVPTGFANAVGNLALDGDGTLYVSDGAQGGLIYRRRPAGSFAPYAALPGERAIGLTLQGTTLYVGGHLGGLHALDTSVPAPPPVVLVMNLPTAAYALAFSSPSTLLAGTESGLYEVDIDLLTALLIENNGEYPAIGADPLNPGSFLLIDANGEHVDRILPPALPTSFFTPTAVDPDGLAIHPVTGEVFISCALDDIIQRIDAAGTGVSTFATGIDFEGGGDAPSPLGFSPTGGELYYGAEVGGVFAIHVISGFPAEVEAEVTAPGGVLSGHVDLTLAADDLQGDDVTATFEFTTDQGETFQICTPAPGSPLANPTGALGTPLVGGLFTWNTIADGIGMGGVQHADVRVAVVDDGPLAFGLIGVDVDNAWPILNCLSSKDGADVTGNLAFVLDVVGPAGSTAEVHAAFSIDDGVTWQAATPAASSPLGSPEAGVSLGSHRFIWNSFADGIARAAAEDRTRFSFEVVDAGGAASICLSGAFSCDNTQARLCGSLCGDCDGNGRVEILDSFLMARVAVGLSPDMDIVQAQSCNVAGTVYPSPSAAVTIVDALTSARHIVGLGGLACCVP